MPRPTLTPLQQYHSIYTRTIERSDSPHHHLDNVSLVQFISDAQHRFQDAFTHPLPKQWTSVNADLTVCYLQQSMRGDTLKIQVGLDPVGISRVAFRVCLRFSVLEREWGSVKIGDDVEEIVVALAEVGVVRTGEDGRAKEIDGELKDGLLRVLEEQQSQK
ncbi:hypothetical protein HDU76_003162 [Blyttiomyces sp. JEL0837]|nr:hypothetical protein HDU76_003162 [Blyttiomyces sp. JEL0837]